MKVFLDTNILVSATATRGLCADVLREVLSSHHLIVSDPLFIELKRILLDKFNVPGDLIAELIEILKQDAQVSIPADLPDIDIKDKDDLIILLSALNGNAEPQKRAHSPQLAAGNASESENSKLPYGRRFPAASCGELQIFITGDKELLNLHKVKNMEIVSPRMFWEKLKAQHNLSNSD